MIELNIDGTIPTRPTKTKTTTCYTSTWRPCPHSSGWYFTVKFLFWTKKLYWCDLCHRAYDKKLIDALLRSRR